ncbi:hypothetical protein BV22DRAFT_155255 [Leucogyrophana mollusca]|uniref:Uncharacterized protein n=1 Tax=Leucogyrophana mollusca TaxID=85980 RepID=A0ACB8BWW3_9AGAM|nr:hypothetical protein BV22DRAFT_155255 [Leucogyrophana mollusca]
MVGELEICSAINPLDVVQLYISLDILSCGRGFVQALASVGVRRIARHSLDAPSTEQRTFWSPTLGLFVNWIDNEPDPESARAYHAGKSNEAFYDDFRTQERVRVLVTSSNIITRKASRRQWTYRLSMSALKANTGKRAEAKNDSGPSPPKATKSPKAPLDKQYHDIDAPKVPKTLEARDVATPRNSETKKPTGKSEEKTDAPMPTPKAKKAPKIAIPTSETGDADVSPGAPKMKAAQPNQTKDDHDSPASKSTKPVKGKNGKASTPKVPKAPSVKETKSGGDSSPSKAEKLSKVPEDKTNGGTPPKAEELSKAERKKPSGPSSSKAAKPSKPLDGDNPSGVSLPDLKVSPPSEGDNCAVTIPSKTPPESAPDKLTDDQESSKALQVYNGPEITPHPKAPETKNHAGTALVVAIEVLDTTRKLAPHSAVQALLSVCHGILVLVQGAIKNQDDFVDVAQQCHDIGVMVWRRTSKLSGGNIDPDVAEVLRAFTRAVGNVKNSIDAAIKENEGRIFPVRMFFASVDHKKIAAWKHDLERRRQDFIIELSLLALMKRNQIITVIKPTAKAVQNRKMITNGKEAGNPGSPATAKGSPCPEGKGKGKGKDKATGMKYPSGNEGKPSRVQPSDSKKGQPSGSNESAHKGKHRPSDTPPPPLQAASTSKGWARKVK